MKIVHPGSGPPIKGVKVPEDVYWVIQWPTPLAGMKYPRTDFPWSSLYAAGFRQVVSLHSPHTDPHSVPYDPAPLTMCFAEQLEDLVSGGPPADEEDEIRKINRAVTATLTAWRSGEGVVVHCAGGRGRSGTVIGCVLRELGFSTDDVLGFLDRLHKVRDRSGWPESQWQRKLVETMRFSQTYHKNAEEPEITNGCT